jgi:hypothetical protein
VPQTPLTAATPYATADDLFVYHDWQQVGEMLVDRGAPAPQRATLVNTATPLGGVLNRLLLAASGQLESACLIGKRYSPADLQALTGAGKERVVKVVCDLAFWTLRQRRQPGSADPKQVPGAQEALDTLTALRTGEQVLGFAESAAAGLDAVAGTPKSADALGDVCRVQDRARPLFGTHGQS